MSRPLTNLLTRPAACLALVMYACGCDPAAPVDTYPYPAGRISLSHLPVDTDRVTGFIGLGNLNVLPEDHGGFFAPPGAMFLEPTIPVYAPADGKIILIGQDWNPDFAPHGHDLLLEMRVSTTMRVLYAHMSDFSAEIWDAAGELEVGYAIAKDVSIEVEAGQVLGFFGTLGVVDWHIKDSELTLDFVNPSRYPDPWLISGCYHDYYQEPLRSALLAITIRTAEPRCGKIDFDVPGRIIGNWFLKDEVPAYAFDDYSTHFAIVYDEIEADRIAISDGIAIRPTSPHDGDDRWHGSRVFWVEGNAPRPEDVGQAHGMVKYAIMDRHQPIVVGVFLVEMLSATELRVERVMGMSPADVAGFGEHARVYVR